MNTSPSTSCLTAGYIGDAVFATEKKAFEEEIRALRQDLSRAKGLGDENGSLRSGSEVALRDEISKRKTLKTEGKSPSGVSSNKTPIRDASMSLETSNRNGPTREDYARSVAANRILQEKLAEAQYINRQWHEYHQKVGRLAARPRDISTDTVHPAKAQTPTYRATPSPRSFSHDTRSINARAKCALQNRDSTSDRLSRDHIYAQRGNRPSQPPANIPLCPLSDSTAETCGPEIPLDHIHEDAAGQEMQLPLGPMDSPVILVEQSLPRKKKSRKRRNPELHENNSIHQGTIQKPLLVKSEPSSSSPLVNISHLASTNPQDSMDLDEIGEKHFTPRKRRRLLDEELDRVSVLTMPTEGGSLGNPTSVDPRQQLLDEELVGIQEPRVPVEGEGCLMNSKAVEEVDKVPKHSQDQPLKIEEDEEPNGQEYDAPRLRGHRRSECHRSDQVELDERALLGPRKNANTHEGQSTTEACHQATSQVGRYSNLTRHTRPNIHGEEDAFLTPSENRWLEEDRTSQQILDDPREGKQAPPRSILRPKDPNANLLPRKGKFLSALKRALPPSQQDATSQPPILGEGREEFHIENSQSFPHDSNKSTGANQVCAIMKLDETPKATERHRRLNTLLSKPPPQKLLMKSTNSKKSTGGQGKTPGKIFKTYGRPGGTKGIKIAPLSIGKSNGINSISSGYGPTDEVLTEHEALRFRSCATLCPEDFKINPTHNHGHNYPISEVVRNRDERKCMQGCRRPNCCGNTIRKVVELGGYIGPPRKSRLSDIMPLDFDSDEDERLLEEYLGDDNVCLKDIPEEKREELLFEARVEQFANAWGKHRYEYKRQPTPPGFWEADMPDTQQERRNRVIAKAMEKMKVEEMHREAMRSNGRYKFRDE